MLAVSLVLLLAAVSCALEANCPQECSCSNIDEYSRRFVCTAVPLTTVGQYIGQGQNLTELWTSPGFTKISLEELEPIRNRDLAVIKFINGAIQDIDRGAFQNLSATLAFLDLTNNKIAVIREGALTGLEPVRVLSLMRNLITDVDVGAFEGLGNLETLSLGFNRLTVLRSGLFRGLEKLRSLEVHDNDISVLEPRALEGLVSLNALVLAGNKVAAFSVEALLGAARLQVLDLEHNALTRLSVGMFPHQLTDLRLGRNRIKTVEDHALSPLHDLLSLSLRRNRLRNLSSNAFQGLRKLKNLHLDENPLRELQREAFRDLADVSHVHLSDTGLQTFPRDVLAAMPDVTSVWLANNNLTTVDTDFLLSLRNLRQVVIHGNPLQCDCSLKNLWRKYIRRTPEFVMREKHYVPQSPADPTCHTPPEFRGKAWDVMNELKCPPA